MADRSLSPSPNKSQNLERGVFSSISSISLYKSVIEERKQLQSNSLLQIKTPKTKSPIRNRLMPSPRLTDRSKSPETRAKGEDENSKLLETVKRLTQQLTKEKKTNDLLEEKLKDQALNHKTETSNALKNSEKLQKTVNSLKNSLVAVTAERDQLLENLKKAGGLLNTCQEEVKTLTKLFVSEISQFITSIDERIKENILKQLRNSMKVCKIDLNNQIFEVEN